MLLPHLTAMLQFSKKFTYSHHGCEGIGLLVISLIVFFWERLIVQYTYISIHRSYILTYIFICFGFSEIQLHIQGQKYTYSTANILLTDPVASFTFTRHFCKPSTSMWENSGWIFDNSCWQNWWSSIKFLHRLNF